MPGPHGAPRACARRPRTPRAHVRRLCKDKPGKTAQPPNLKMLCAIEKALRKVLDRCYPEAGYGAHARTRPAGEG